MSALGWVLRGVVVVIGKLLGQRLGARRELAGRRRDLRLDAMIAAWRGLVSYRGAELDRTLADIQLFGTAEQAERAVRAARALECGAHDALYELLESLRADLR